MAVELANGFFMAVGSFHHQTSHAWLWSGTRTCTVSPVLPHGDKRSFGFPTYRYIYYVHSPASGQQVYFDRVHRLHTITYNQTHEAVRAVRLPNDFIDAIFFIGEGGLPAGPPAPAELASSLSFLFGRRRARRNNGEERRVRAGGKPRVMHGGG